MNTVTTMENTSNQSARKKKFITTLSKILLFTGIAIGGAVLLVALYQIIQYLFVAALLFIAWLCPRRGR